MGRLAAPLLPGRARCRRPARGTSALGLLALLTAPSVVCGLRGPPVSAIAAADRFVPQVAPPKVKCWDHEVALHFDDQAVREVTYGGISTWKHIRTMCSPGAAEYGVHIASAHIFRCLLGALMLSSLASDTKDGCIFYSKGVYIKLVCVASSVDLDTFEVVISGAQKFRGEHLYGPLFPPIRLGIMLASSSFRPAGLCSCFDVRSFLAPAIRTVFPSMFNDSYVWKQVLAIEEVAHGLTGMDFATHVDVDHAKDADKVTPYFVHTQAGSCFRWALKGKVEQLHPVIREFADNFTERFSYIEDLVTKTDFELHGASKDSGALSEAAWYFTNLAEFAFMVGEKPGSAGTKPLCLPPILESLPSK